MRSCRNFARNCINQLNKVLAKREGRILSRNIKSVFHNLISFLMITECILQLFFDVFYVAVSYFS